MFPTDKDMTMKDFIELIEYSLFDICDILFKKALKSYSGNYFIGENSIFIRNATDDEINNNLGELEYLLYSLDSVDDKYNIYQYT
jgi:hypothetical protein